MTRDNEFDHRLKTYREIVQAYRDEVTNLTGMAIIARTHWHNAEHALTHKKAQLSTLETILSLMEAMGEQ